ncbi:MAG: hypothetical protein OJF59_000761 [Cytophagales bacterium]|jgi:nitrite reductase/ring-hydroxylating ferredoxin subunit|nr:hypothetical protein [Bacteroidota bacterium]MBS1979753.1 hypothetical protein [Bacteroidota bacterium]WHZ07008.1 MAG: hypothetical protein OJF59_000761 [Cytophagales bacterium]
MTLNKIRWIFGLALLVGATQAQAQAVFPEITVNLTYPQFQRLKTDGGFVYLDGGLKGIILYRSGENSFNAYDRACAHDFTANCSVQVDGSTLFMIDRCCNSSFSFPDGQPTGGPAQRPLIQYRVELSGNTLKISDEIIN